MTTLKKLQFLKFESNLPNRQLSLYIYTNNKLLTSTPLSSLINEPRELEIPSSSILEIRLKDSHKFDILAVNIPVSLLKKSYQWVPLYSTSKLEILASIPEDPSQPRLLIRSCPVDHRQSEEIIDNYEETPTDAYESFTSELVLASLIESPGMDSEELLGKSDLKAKYNKQSLILKVLTKQLESTNEKHLQLQKKTEALEVKLAKITEQLSINSENASQRERSLLDMVQEKDTEIQQGVAANMALQGKLRAVENAKEHLADQVNRMELEIERLKDIESELEISNTKLQRSEMIQDQLNKTLVKLSRNISEPEADNNLKNQLILKDQEIQMLKSVAEEVKTSGDMQISSLTFENNELKHLLSTSQEQERFLASKLLSIETDKSESKSLAFVDHAFSESMRKLNLQGQYSRLNDFTYQVKGKAISVAICRGGIFSRVGSCLLSLEEFLEDILDKKETRPLRLETTHLTRSETTQLIRPETSLLIRPDTSLSIRPDTSLSIRTEKSENIDKSLQKVPSQKTFLRSTQSSQNKIKATTDRSPLRDRNRVRSIDRKPFR